MFFTCFCVFCCFSIKLQIECVSILSIVEIGLRECNWKRDAHVFSHMIAKLASHTVPGFAKKSCGSAFIGQSQGDDLCFSS